MTEPPELDREESSRNMRLAERRLAARSRELDALQSLGRHAAEAGTPEELFSSVISALHRAEELDLALVAYEWDGAPVTQVYVSRPFGADYIEAAALSARRFLGWETGAEPSRAKLDGYDGARGERDGFREEDVLLLPILRGGRPVACLLAAPSAESDRQGVRLVYSASNQLSLHLDRLLRAREVETDRFRAIVDSMPQGVLLTNCRLHVLQANRAAERILASGDVGGARGFAEGVQRLGLAPLVERVRDGGAAAAEGEARIGGDRIWSVTVSRMPGIGKEPAGLVFVLSDVTDSRRLQEQLAQSEKMSSLGQMISGVAHELNNPLASIVGYAQLVRGAASENERLNKRLTVLGQEAERCRKIVRNLLSFARQHEQERKPLSLNQVVDNVVALLQYQMRVDGILIERELDRSLPALEGDVHELEQVLVNLLTNAAHAIRQTGEPGTVKLITRLAGEEVLLEIRDTGVGIPDEALSRLFDPFFTTKAPGEGTGLGLSLVYGIVTAHGGSIEAQSHADSGATFRIRLPHTPAEARGAAPTPAPPRMRPVARGHVLVVDDDESVAKMICDALAKDGHSVTCARGGLEALEEARTASFDVVVCDVRMPDMSGERLHDALRRVQPELARNLLWTTGDTLGPVPGELARRTGLDLLTKPFDLDELCDRVRERLGADESG